MTHYDPRLLSALRRQNFELFLVKAFETLHPGDPPLELAWYLKAICHALTEVHRGNERRLVVTVPPRHLKSVAASVAFAAWVLGHDPKAKIMVASYSQDLARHHSNQTRTLMESEWYQRDFPATRIPAREIEAAVVQCLAQAFDNPLSLAATAELPLEPERLIALNDLGVAAALSVRAHDPEQIRSLVRSVKVLPDRVSLELSTAGIAEALKLQCASKATIRLQLEGRVRRSGKVVRLIQPDGRSVAATQPSQSLIKLIAKSRRWWKRLQAGDIHVAELARQEGVSGSYLANTLRLAFLSPRLVEMIVEGKQPAHLTGKMLTAHGFPASWAEQHARFA